VESRCLRRGLDTATRMGTPEHPHASDESASRPVGPWRCLPSQQRGVRVLARASRGRCPILTGGGSAGADIGDDGVHPGRLARRGTVGLFRNAGRCEGDRDLPVDAGGFLATAIPAVCRHRWFAARPGRSAALVRTGRSGGACRRRPGAHHHRGRPPIQRLLATSGYPPDEGAQHRPPSVVGAARSGPGRLAGPRTGPPDPR
jgi:hypothetical protein